MVSPHVKAACRNAWVHGFDSRHLHEEGCTHTVEIAAGVLPSRAWSIFEKKRRNYRVYPVRWHPSSLLARRQDSPVLESTGGKAPPVDQPLRMRGVRGYLGIRSGTHLLDVREGGGTVVMAAPIPVWWKGGH